MSSGKWRPFCPGLNVLKQAVQLAIAAFHNDYTSEEEYLGKLDFVRFMFKTILDRF